MNVLFVNSCVRKNDSRTNKLANEFIKKLYNKNPNIKLNEITLMDEDLKPLLYDDIKKRDELIFKNSFDDNMFKYANQFKNNDLIIIATPFWDLSFPSLLKVYIEKLCVNNLTFKYEESGQVGLCSVSKFVLIATSGGDIIDNKLDYLSDIIDFLSANKVKKYYSFLTGLDMINEKEVNNKIDDTIKGFDKIINEL